MSKMLCLECGEIYNKEDLKPRNIYYNKYYCSKVSCCKDSKLIELDENIIFPIKILNEKGYVTKYCCAGHLYEDCISPYVYFEYGFAPDKKIPIPRYWEWDSDNYGVDYIILRVPSKYLDNITLIEKQKVLFKALQSLLEWCDNLPNYSGEKEKGDFSF